MLSEHKTTQLSIFGIRKKKRKCFLVNQPSQEPITYWAPDQA